MHVNGEMIVVLCSKNITKKSYILLLWYRSLQSASALQLVLDAINSAIEKLYFCGSSFLINYFLGQMKLNEFYNYVVKRFGKFSLPNSKLI